MLIHGEPNQWIEECLESLHGAPINLVVRDGLPGEIGLARASAFRVGDAPYVAWVDPDDRVLPGAFEAALEVLERDSEVVSTYCNYRLIDAVGGTTGQTDKPPWHPIAQLCRLLEVHHLHVVRRAAVQEILWLLPDWQHGIEEWVMMAALLDGAPGEVRRHHRVPVVGYEFRRHSETQRAGSQITRENRRNAVRRYRDLLLGLHRRGILQSPDQ